MDPTTWMTLLWFILLNRWFRSLYIRVATTLSSFHKCPIPKLCFLLLILTQGYVFIDLREKGRGGGRERAKHWCERERHWSIASCSYPDRGLNLQSRYVPWLGIKTATFGCMRWFSNQFCHVARAQTLFLWLNLRLNPGIQSLMGKIQRVQKVEMTFSGTEWAWLKMRYVP